MTNETTEAEQLRNGLKLFREFVLLNAKVWESGAGDHSHPVWAHVAELVGETSLLPDPATSAFIQPDNRKPLGSH